MQKTQIYYPRTYRRLTPNKFSQWIYILLIVLPCLILLLLFYSKISLILSEYTARYLREALPGIEITIGHSEYIPYFGGVSFVSLPGKLPSFEFTVANLLISLALFILFTHVKKLKGAPLFIYLSIALMIHIVSCLYFALAPESFPYTVSDYSDLYIKQQIGMWLSFLVLLGFVTGFLNNASLLQRIVTFAGVMIYSAVFGSIRYLVFLYLIHIGSSLYMPTFFFSLGPFFDFLYLVCFYSAFVGRVIKKFDSRKGRLTWGWL